MPTGGSFGCRPLVFGTNKTAEATIRFHTAPACMIGVDAPEADSTIIRNSKTQPCKRISPGLPPQ